MTTNVTEKVYSGNRAGSVRRGTDPRSMRWLHEPDLSSPVAFLDDVGARLRRREDVARTMEILCDGLWWLKQNSTEEEWHAVVRLARAHPTCQLVHEDPFTFHSFSRPRGYPGDAGLIDLVYYDQGYANLAGASELGLMIFDRNKDASGPAAVRERRDFMAALIDEAAADMPRPHVLATACGHLREAQLSAAVTQHRLGRFVALDQDAASLELVKHNLGGYGIDPVCAGVKSLLNGTFRDQSFDLVYAAGLFDYLQDRFATTLVRRMFELLKPGGRCVIGNFAPDIQDVGYMEAYMDWYLVYRDGGQLAELASTVPSHQIALKRTYTLGNPDVFYLELRKRRLAVC